MTEEQERVIDECNLALASVGLTATYEVISEKIGTPKPPRK